MDDSYQLKFATAGTDGLLITLTGSWKVHHALPESASLEDWLDSHPGIKQIDFDSTAMTAWDSALLTFLLRVTAIAAKNTIQVDQSGLPDGVQRLLHLASAVPERGDARRTAGKVSFLARIGNQGMAVADTATEALAFLGEAALSLARLLRGKAQFRGSDLWLTMQQTGAQALGIVALISFLVGIILAYIGAAQLVNFGATMYVADLVGIGMARAMGAMMTGIIMAGRTGAAFAAQLGTMQVNEEIDALETLGISAMDFLVLPRMLALILMMPLLTLYSILFGILGGLFVSVTTFDIGVLEYLHRTQEAVKIRHVMVGLTEASVYGILVAVAGCYQGIKCGRSSSAVGAAATSAVVSGILLIVIATAFLTVIFNVLGI
ncbi:MAG: STAS domain-containing protein [Gammaproteobacteria bacterium]|nr:STAS domain-containing protein [Gammaproteobacteria bacterium]